MQSQQPTGERQSPPLPHSSAHPTQAHLPQTTHPSLPPQVPTIPATSINQVPPPPPLFSIPNQIITLPRPRGNMFAQNKPIDSHPTTPDRDLAEFEVNSKALSEGHKATHQTLWTESSGVQEINIPGVGKRLVRRTTPASPLSIPGAAAGAVVPMSAGMATPSPGGRQRNSVFAPFKVPSSTLSPRSSLEAIAEGQGVQEKVTKDDKEKGKVEEEKVRRSKEEQERGDEATIAVLKQLDEENRRAEQEHAGSSPADKLQRGTKQQASFEEAVRAGMKEHEHDRWREQQANEYSATSGRGGTFDHSKAQVAGQQDDRVPEARDRGQEERQLDRRRDDVSGPQDIRNLRAEQHRYHTQNQYDIPQYSEYQMSGPGSMAPPRSNEHYDRQRRGHASSRLERELEFEYARGPGPQNQRQPESRHSSSGRDHPDPNVRNQATARRDPRQAPSKYHEADRPAYHHQGPYIQNPIQGNQDPFIDHVSPPKPAQKRSRPEDQYTTREPEHGYDHGQREAGTFNHKDFQEPPPQDRDQVRAPKRLREQSTQTEDPSSDLDEASNDQEQALFDPTAPIEPYDYIDQIQEPWNEAMAQHVPYIDEWAERFISTSIDYVLAVYKCSHKSSIKLGESLQDGVDDILAQQHWQNGRRQTFIDFRKQMAKVAQALGDIDPEDEDMPVSPAKKGV